MRSGLGSTTGVLGQLPAVMGRGAITVHLNNDLAPWKCQMEENWSEEYNVFSSHRDKPLNLERHGMMG